MSAKNIKLEFTLNGRKKTYFRRIDYSSKPLTTTNINSAKLIREEDVKPILLMLMKEYGKDNVKNVKTIKG